MKYFTLICAIFCLLWPSNSHARPVEIKSENFVLTGNLKAKDGEALLRDLEMFRDNLFTFYGKPVQPEVVPVPIYVVKKNKHMSYVTGAGDFGGMYTTTLRGPVFVLNARYGFGRKGKGAARHIALHEYSHHVTANFIKDQYPLWYNEGYADYLATYKYQKDTFKIGEAYKPYSNALADEDWLPMITVLGSTKDYPFNMQDGSKSGKKTILKFYAQSWLAAHYLNANEDAKAKLKDYVERVNNGADPITAFEKSVGYSMEDFETELKDYYKSNDFKVKSFTGQKVASDIKISRRSLSKRERKSYLLEARRAFSFSPKQAASSAKEYKKLEKKLGKSADILSAQADLKSIYAGSEDDLKAARLLAEQAIEKDPNHIDANRVLGGIIVNQYVRRAGGSKTDMPKARSYLRKVLESNIDDPMSNYYLAASYYKDPEMPPEGRRAARFTLDYFKDRSFVGSNLNIAGILVDAGEYEHALKAIQFASVWAPEHSMRAQAQNLKRYISDKQQS